MTFDAAFSGIWEAVFSDKVEFLSVYRFEREKMYPGVPVRQFSDWQDHKEWMRSTRDKHLRKLNNIRVQAEADQASAEEGQG